MPLDKTRLIVNLDRSGSMSHRKDDHQGGLRSFIRDQKQLPGDVRVTFVRFDTNNPFELVHDNVPIDQIDESSLTLVPRGGTPLLDSIGRTITHVRSRIADEHPDQVVMMIITDGQENASTEFSSGQIKAMILECEAAGWKILYLGANVDEFAESGKMGIGANNAMGYADSKAGVHAMYASVSSNMRAARSHLQAGDSPKVASASYDFSTEQRTNSKKEDEA